MNMFSAVWPFPTSWKRVSKEKQETRDRLIENALMRIRETELGEAIGVDMEREILSTTASEIVQQIQLGDWTASKVVRTYIKCAAEVHKKLNCLTEILFNQALDHAAEIDAEFAKMGKLKGPLHGVPITFKDQFDIKGFDSTIGYSSFANKPAKQDASLVTHLISLGAIPIAKTNVPQTLFAFESSNPIFGRTSNPYNTLYSSGGSSGGEAALIRMNGSVIGFGTDFGGSLRIPASWSGVYSFKSSAGRWCIDGVISPIPGSEDPILGPIARSIDDIELACRVCFGAKGHESNAMFPVPYREVELKKELKFGWYTSDGMVKASPACKRAVLETVEALERAGHECVELKPTIGPECLSVFAALLGAAGYDTIMSHLGWDPMEWSMFLVLLGPSLPGFLRTILSWIGVNILHDTVLPPVLKESRRRSVKELFELSVKREKLRKKWYDEIWTKYGLDGIIAPVLPTPALPHGATATLSPITTYSALYSLVDSPVGVVPVTRVDKDLDKLTPEWTSLSSPDSYSKLLEGDLYIGMLGIRKPMYDSKEMHGLPVGVQVVGKVWEEEKVIKMMRVVDDALGERGFGNGIFV